MSEDEFFVRGYDEPEKSHSSRRRTIVHLAVEDRLREIYCNPILKRSESEAVWDKAKVTCKTCLARLRKNEEGE